MRGLCLSGFWGVLCVAVSTQVCACACFCVGANRDDTHKPTLLHPPPQAIINTLLSKVHIKKKAGFKPTDKTQGAAANGGFPVQARGAARGCARC